MKEVTMYRSDRGSNFNTPEEAETDDFETKMRERIAPVFPRGDGYTRHYTQRQIASQIESVLKALGIPFDRDEFMAKEF